MFYISTGSFLGIPSKEEKKENEQEKKEKIYEASREIDHSFDDENFHGMLEEMGVVEVVDELVAGIGKLSL